MSGDLPQHLQTDSGIHSIVTSDYEEEGKARIWLKTINDTGHMRRVETYCVFHYQEAWRDDQEMVVVSAIPSGSWKRVMIESPFASNWDIQARCGARLE